MDVLLVPRKKKFGEKRIDISISIQGLKVQTKLRNCNHKPESVTLILGAEKVKTKSFNWTVTVIQLNRNIFKLVQWSGYTFATETFVFISLVG